MRLLHTTTLELAEFIEGQVPEYAILSHTWRDEEVSFQDLQGGKAAAKAGYLKIIRSCQKAARHQLQYIWIDTCSIDKTSRAELSEAINSMFRWYQEAEIRFAVLDDVSTEAEHKKFETSFAQRRWFTRGWTLQELLAPRMMIFYDQNWKIIGVKDFLGASIAKITGIPEAFLKGKEDIQTASVAMRMSWAAKRQTTRAEDLAYCLLGIFNVNMSMICGEREKSFIRLQEGIIKRSDDQSLFAWGTHSEPGTLREKPNLPGLLA